MKNNSKKAKDNIQTNIQKREINSTTYFRIKWLAIISMLIGNIGTFLYFCGYITNNVYLIFGSIAKLSYPLFAYLLVECYYFTSNKIKHTIRLLVLGLISEVPFNIFYYHQMPYGRHWNNIFEFFIVFVMFMLMDAPIEKIIKAVRPKTDTNSRFVHFFKFSYQVDVLGITTLLVYYFLGIAWFDILFLGFLKFSRERKHNILWFILAFLIYLIPQIGANPLTLLYIINMPVIGIFKRYDNNKSVDKMKYLSFLSHKTFQLIARYSYPIHLSILSAIEVLLFLSNR